jgi:uncharacterized protein
VILPELPFEMRAYGPEAGWSYADGSLRVTSGPRQDCFVAPGRSETDAESDAPRLLGSLPPGDGRLQARVTVDFAASFDAGAFYLHVGEQEWAKLCLEASPRLEPTVVSVVTRGISDDANAFTVRGTSVWLRLTRAGRAFAFHASPDGTAWTFVRHFALGTPEQAAAARVGFLAQSPVGEGCAVAFDEIAYAAGAPEDMRDGS